MKNKYISIQSHQVLRHFYEKGKDYFSTMEASDALPNSKEGAIRELLSDMAKRGLLMRLKRGWYYIIPYEQNAETFMPDWHLLAAPLANGETHYIGYYSALQIHNLIVQPSLKEQIVVPKQMRPSLLLIKKVPFQFIYHNKKHFFGYKKVWIDSFNKVYCSDLEKTLIDCLFKPDYAGGIVEVGRALFMARTKIDFQKLFDYSQQFQSQAVIHRLGFLLETLEMGSSIIEQLQEAKSQVYVLLDTELPKQGKHSSRWHIQQNIDTETIKSALFT